MAVKLSTNTIDQNVLAKNVSFEAFKDMVNTTNTTNRGYVRFDRNAKGEIGLAKVSKHWYSSWLIDRRTNIDAGHNKQMRRLFVDSMKFDFLSQNTKDIIKNIKYVGGGDTLKDSALSRIEIKNAVEAYERDYNTKRADILINMLKDFCTKLNLPDAFQIANNAIDKKTQIKEFIKTYANLQTPEELNKLLADVDKALFSKTVYVLDKPKLDPTGKVQEDANGTSIEEFQKFMDNLRGTLERGIRVQQLKECVNFIFDAALKNTSIIGLLGEDGSKFLQQKDNNGMTHRDKLRSYLKSVMKDRIPNFNDGILTVTNEATDNLNVLDLFIDNIAGRILKQKIENCLEYQGMDENDIKELGVGSKEELIEKEKDISTILDSLTEYIDGVKNALNSEETDLSKALGGGLDKIVGKAVDSTGKTQDKQNLSDLMNVRYANMGMNVRGMVISAVLNSKTDGTEAGKVINDITDDMMKSVPSFAKRVRVDDFTHKYICEHFGGVNLDQGLTETQKVMDKVKQRVTDIKVALVIQNGNVRVKDNGNMELQLNDDIKTGKLPHRKRQAVDYNVTDFNSILMDNLQRITKGYGAEENECIIKDKKIYGKLTANTLSKYLEVNIQKALNESYKMDMDSQVPIDLNPKHCFDALLDMYYAYEDGKKEAGAIMDLFKKKLFTICNMHRNNGNLSTNEATDIYNKGVASLEAKLETVTEQFFNQAPMKYEDAVNFMVNNFKAQLSSVVFDANKDLLDGILKQASTSNAERKQKTGVQFDSYLIKTLQDSKKVAETFLDNFLKTSSIGDNKCPFITVDDKKKLMLSTLQKTYYQLLIDSFSGKKLTDDEHPVITPKFVKKINASFEEKAKDVIKNFEKFEKTFMTRFDDVVMRNIKDNVANNEATRLGMAMKQLTNEKDKEALLASMKNGMTNALGFSCNALFKSYLQEPQLYENTKEYVNALLENQVFLANNNFSVAVVDVMDGHYNNTVNALYDEKSGGNLLVSVANEYNEACLEIIKNCENKNYTFEEAQKNGAVKKAGIDEDVFKALHGKIKDKAGIKPYVLDSLAKEIETRVKSNLLFYGMGTIEAAKQRITNEVKAEFKKKLVRFGNFKEVFERLAEPVSHNFSGVPEARRKRLCQDMLLSILNEKGGKWPCTMDTFMTVQGKGVEKVNEGALKAWIEERFTEEVKDIKKEKIEENQGHIAGVETAYGKFVGYLDKQINAFRDELDKKYPKLKGEVLDYIGEKALKSLRGTFLTNLNNQPEKYQNEKTWKDTFDEWTVPNFIRNLCNELATTSFHDVRYVKKFLAGLGEDDSHPEMKVFGDFVKKESESSMRLSKDEIAAIRKRNAQRDQAVNLIRNNVKVWGENLHIQKATVTAQKAVIDRWCERVANIVNKNEEGGIAGLITAQIDEFYKDFKTDILDGIRGMILMVNFNEDMLPAARAAFDKWIVDLNLPGGKDSKTVAELNQLFTERVADLQKRRAVNKDVEEPILTIGFMDKLLKVVDTDGIKEKLKAWKEANMGKYQAFFLDKNNSTKEYMNLNVAVGRELNKNEIAVTKNMDVQVAIQENKQMMEKTLSDIMDSVAEKYVKKQLCFHAFDDGFMAEMDKKIDEEVTNRLREIEGKCKTNYSHAVKMATNAYELERQDAFDTMVFYMFGLKQGTFRCNDMQKSLDGLYTVMNNNKGKAWFEGIRAKLGDLKYRDRGNYNVFVPFYQLYDKFVISIEKAIGANIDKFTDPMELTMAMRYARRFFIEKSKMLQTMTTLADNLTKSKDQNDKTWGDDLKEVIKMMRDRLGGFDEDNADAEYQLYKERLGMTDDLLNKVGKENKLNVDDIIKGFTDFEKNLILRRERLLDKNANNGAQQVENK